MARKNIKFDRRHIFYQEMFPDRDDRMYSFHVVCWGENPPVIEKRILYFSFKTLEWKRGKARGLNESDYKLILNHKDVVENIFREWNDNNKKEEDKDAE